jgi:hypothetical protein
VKGRLKLFPMMLALVLVTGCKGSSDDSAQAAPASAPQQVAVAVVQPDPPPPAPPAVLPSRPAPIVTVGPPGPTNSLDLPPSSNAAQPAPFPREVTAATAATISAARNPMMRNGAPISRKASPNSAPAPTRSWPCCASATKRCRTSSAR